MCRNVHVYGWWKREGVVKRHHGGKVSGQILEVMVTPSQVFFHYTISCFEFSSQCYFSTFATSWSESMCILCSHSVQLSPYSQYGCLSFSKLDWVNVNNGNVFAIAGDWDNSFVCPDDMGVRKRAAKTAAAARRWREYSRQGVDRRGMHILLSQSATEDEESEKTAAMKWDSSLLSFKQLSPI